MKNLPIATSTRQHGGIKSLFSSILLEFNFILDSAGRVSLWRRDYQTAAIHNGKVEVHKWINNEVALIMLPNFYFPESSDCNGWRFL